MADQRASLELIEDFLAQKRIAIAGISRNPASDSARLLQELSRRGYDVVAVNPNATELHGRPCFPRVRDIRPPVHAVLVMTSPEVTEAVVSDCDEAGVRLVWLYRGAAGPGSVSPQALALCQQRGIDVIPGQCPFMFLPGSAGIHRFHGFLRKLIGRYPQRSGVPLKHVA